MRSSPNFAAIAGEDNGNFLPQNAKAGAGAGAGNGRVDLLSPLPKFTIPTYQSPACPDNTTFKKQALTGTLNTTPLSDLYFSESNINALQEGIRYRIFQETDGKFTIGRQSDTELKVVMRSIFLQYSLNRDGDVLGQVRSLNARVLDWVVPEVLSNLKQHVTYIRDASTMPMPLERSQLLTSKGTKTLEHKSFF